MLGFKNGNCNAKNKTLIQKRLVICIGLIVLIILFGLAFIFTTLSAPLRDISPQTVEYVIDPSIQGTEMELLIEATKMATAMWSDRNSGLEFVLTDKQDVLQIQAHVPWFAGLVSGGFTNGFTKCPIWDMDTTNCVVYIHQDLLDDDLDKYQSPKEQRVSTIAHEFGHVLGLNHYPSNSTNHLMGTPNESAIWVSTDTKGYVVPEPTQ